MNDRGNDELEVPGGSDSSMALVVAAWVVVAIPLLYGVWQAILKALQLFGG
ncbi:hypothetical protein FB554_1325 [Barrientosiimonas humi]|uniref:Uncharacterized protein n=1 Tax=Barrientosiimonas humi TaxID=999931 RepID=A0A542XBH3_9MICO|nr:hypothetical protein [Barrientosiimonas humi]TQL33189.1 hypothetical protein FB554_1325 [Barrientosiimonas humi]CAG7573178.1 hypothetical protein BH39T_PBIAJDOK_01804 [Barrientosiimonas humi]